MRLAKNVCAIAVLILLGLSLSPLKEQSCSIVSMNVNKRVSRMQSLSIWLLPILNYS